MSNIPRLNLHLRLQHGIILLAATVSLTTGMGISFAFLPGLIGFDSWYRLHRWSGLTAAATVAYHVLYLFVRGYVEGLNWSSFPLAWTRSDLTAAGETASYLAGGRQEPPESGMFSPSQKALYWGTGLMTAALALTGGVVSYWEMIPGYGSLAWLGPLGHLHRGLALSLLAFALWHLYGVLVWRGRLAPEWSWITGSIPESLAATKFPSLLRIYRSQERARLEHLERQSGEEEDEEERKVERETVEADLQEGNRLAKEEKFVDALFYYRRALERYPGYSQARYNMAVVLRKMGERTMAAEGFRRFLKDDPFHPLARRAQEYIDELEEGK